MQRGHAQIEAQFVYRLQTLGGFGGKADQLNAYSVFLDDPGYFERDLARYAGVTQQDLASRGAEVSAHRQPRGGERRAEGQALARAAGFHAGGGVVSAGTTVRGFPPSVRRCRSDSRGSTRTRCPNRLSLWSAEHRTLPVVTFMLVLPVGSAADFEGYEGLAAITGDMMDEGTGNLSAIDVNAAFARIGAHLETDVSADATMFTVTSLAKFAPQALSLLADCVIRPRLGVDDFDRIRQLRLTRLVQIRDMPSAIADRAFMQVVYGTHPYAHMALGHRRVAAAAHHRHRQDVSFAFVPRVERHADRVGRHRCGRLQSDGRWTRSGPGRTALRRFPTTPRSPRHRRHPSIGWSLSTSRARRRARFASAKSACRATRPTTIR